MSLVQHCVKSSLSMLLVFLCVELSPTQLLAIETSNENRQFQRQTLKGDLLKNARQLYIVTDTGQKYRLKTFDGLNLSTLNSLDSGDNLTVEGTLDDSETFILQSITSVGIRKIIGLWVGLYTAIQFDSFASFRVFEPTYGDPRKTFRQLRGTSHQTYKDFWPLKIHKNFNPLEVLNGFARDRHSESQNDSEALSDSVVHRYGEVLNRREAVIPMQESKFNYYLTPDRNGSWAMIYTSTEVGAVRLATVKLNAQNMLIALISEQTGNAIGQMTYSKIPDKTNQ